MQAASTAFDLRATTPDAWYQLACERWRELLVDHANCEKKAASTALSFIFTYPEDTELTDRLSRLAREELRHFEQVQKMMRELKVGWQRMAPSRYADGLRRTVRRAEPDRQLDLLVCGALIEARSCERFIGLAPRLPTLLGNFYAGLAASEARHRSVYLRLAERHADRYGGDVAAAFGRLGSIEAELISSPDPQFRFHSGEPA